MATVVLPDTVTMVLQLTRNFVVASEKLTNGTVVLMKSPVPTMVSVLYATAAMLSV